MTLPHITSDDFVYKYSNKSVFLLNLKSIFFVLIISILLVLRLPSQIKHQIVQKASIPSGRISSISKIRNQSNIDLVLWHIWTIQLNQPTCQIPQKLFLFPIPWIIPLRRVFEKKNYLLSHDYFTSAIVSLYQIDHRQSLQAQTH